MSRAGEFGSALIAERPFDALYALAKRQVGEGKQRLRLVEELHQLSIALSVEGHGEVGAVVRGVMDCVGGWCTPDMRI